MSGSLSQRWMTLSNGSVCLLHLVIPTLHIANVFCYVFIERSIAAKLHIVLLIFALLQMFCSYLSMHKEGSDNYNLM